MKMGCKIVLCLFLTWILPSSMVRAEALQTLNFDVDGVQRTALIYLPPHSVDGPVPLVFVFHGHGGSSHQAELSFQTDQLWPEAISIYPQGLNTPGQLTDPDGLKPGWQRALGSEGDRDLHFFDAMLAQLKTDYTIDPKRIYCTGHSNGGGFTYLLWKARGDTFAAVAPSSAAALGYAPELPPKPALILGGRNDPLVKFQWQQMTMDAIRKVNGCETNGTAWEDGATMFASKSSTPLVTYVHDGGHPMDQNEPGLIAKFFQQQKMATTKP